MNNRGEISSITLSEVFSLQQSGQAMIFDARPAFFHGMGHIPGAVNIPAKNCDPVIHAREQEIKAAVDAGKTLIVYCTSPTCPDEVESDARTMVVESNSRTRLSIIGIQANSTGSPSLSSSSRMISMYRPERR